MTGERIDTATAEAWGLIVRGVPQDQLDDEVQRVVESLLKLAPEAQRGYKRASIRALPRMNSLEIMEVAITPNGAEGLAAFADKRSPDWGPQPTRCSSASTRPGEHRVPHRARRQPR